MWISKHFVRCHLSPSGSLPDGWSYWGGQGLVTFGRKSAGKKIESRNPGSHDFSLGQGGPPNPAEKWLTSKSWNEVLMWGAVLQKPWRIDAVALAGLAGLVWIEVGQNDN